MSDRQYYHAYDERYKQIHSLGLHWFDEAPSAVVQNVMQRYGITNCDKLLEIGCGEGRDAFFLFQQGFDLLATDVAPAAVSYCQKKMPAYQDRFRILDCRADQLPCKYNFIYAVAVIHMLVLDADRNAFYRFIYSHLDDVGVALVCSMGDGTTECQTDIRTAFDIQRRIHEQTGTAVDIVSTSCRIVNFQTFCDEIERNCLQILEKGHTSVAPDFPQMIFAVVKKAE